MAYMKNSKKVNKNAFWNSLKLDIAYEDIEGTKFDKYEFESARRMLLSGEQIIAGRTENIINTYQITG